MTNAGLLRPNYQEIIDENVGMRIELVELELENESLRKKLTEDVNVERAKLEKLREKARTAMKTLRDRYVALINKLRTTIHELEEECDHLRCIAVDRKEEAEQICRLQDELEVARSRLALQENAHREEVEELEKSHQREIAKYEKIIADFHAKSISIENMKKVKANIIAKNSQVNEAKWKRKKKGNFTPKWPNLNIQKISANSTTTEDQLPAFINEQINSIPPRTENFHSDNIITTEKPTELINKHKKRKLFSEEQDVMVDI